MHIKLPATTLLPALRRASDAADRKSTMPMLAMACLRATANHFTIAGTDLNLTTITAIPTIGATEGGLCVNAKALHDIVANLPSGDVSIKRIENNWAEIKAGKVSYRIVGMPDRDFPKIPAHAEATFVELDAAVLARMVDRTLFSVCNDETRFHLNGVLFESNGSVASMASTDGHRLSRVRQPLPQAPMLSAGVIVPKRGLTEIKKLLDGAKVVQLAVKPPFLFVQRDQAVIAVKLIDAQFPPVDQVIPKAHKRRAVVDADLLRSAVKRCALLASETRGLKLAFSGSTLTLSTDDPDVGEVRDEVDCEYSGDPITVGVNPKYVVDLLPQMGDAGVVIELGTELEPIAFKPADDPDGYLGIVMPMRI